MHGQEPTKEQELEEQVFWIAHGELSAPPESKQPDLPLEKELLHRRGYIKVTQNASGSTIKWDLFASNWASMYFALEWIGNLTGPYKLNYFLAGWFEEVYERSEEHTSELQSLRHLVCRLLLEK